MFAILPQPERTVIDASGDLAASLPTLRFATGRFVADAQREILVRELLRPFPHPFRWPLRISVFLVHFLHHLAAFFAWICMLVHVAGAVAQAGLQAGRRWEARLLTDIWKESAIASPGLAGNGSSASRSFRRCGSRSAMPIWPTSSTNGAHQS
jgi:hypothetical protein